MRLSFHFIFWFISVAVLYRIFTIDYDNGIVDFVYTIVFHIPLILVVYLNYFLIQKLLDFKKYAFYIISIIVGYVAGVMAHYLVFDFICPIVLPQFFMVSLSTLGEISQYIGAYIIISLLVRLSYDRFLIRDKQIALEYAYKENQLEHLKSQLNPHFLFNSLNNIYSMTTTDVEKGRESIIRLSDTLRYMLYKTDSDRVPLMQELEYIENYIELEKLRLESLKMVSVEIPSISNQLHIAPLILLPFVENCFKHCDKNNPKIDIRIEIRHRELYLYCRNNKAVANSKIDGGLGLSNAQERLNFLYPELHVIQIKNGANYYRLELEINLNEKV